MPLLASSSKAIDTCDGRRPARIVVVCTMVLQLIWILAACKSRDQASTRQPPAAPLNGRCPDYAATTTDWVWTPTSDGRAVLLLPIAFRLVPTDSGQLWASKTASISYRTGGGARHDHVPTQPARFECTEVARNGMDLRYYYAQAATGAGYYLQAAMPLGTGDTIRLVGFARDSVEGVALLEVARRSKPGGERQ